IFRVAVVVAILLRFAGRPSHLRQLLIYHRNSARLSTTEYYHSDPSCEWKSSSTRNRRTTNERSNRPALIAVDPRTAVNPASSAPDPNPGEREEEKLSLGRAIVCSNASGRISPGRRRVRAGRKRNNVGQTGICLDCLRW